MAMPMMQNFQQNPGMQNMQNPGMLPNQGQIVPNRPESGMWDWLFGTSGQNYSTLDPNQQSILQMLLGQGSQDLQNPYQGFQPIREAATNDFFQNIVPRLHAQFAGNSALSSPQLQTNLSSASAGLAQRLSAMQAQFGQQNKQNALQQLQLGLKPHLDYSYRQPGLAENALVAGSEKFGKLAGNYLGGKLFGA